MYRRYGGERNGSWLYLYFNQLSESVISAYREKGMDIEFETQDVTIGDTACFDEYLIISRL